MLFAVMAAGCGGKAEDSLVKEQIATLEKLAAAYAKVIDNKSYEAAEPEISSLRGRILELEKKLTELGPERKDAALKKHAAELEAARLGLRDARKKAAETAWGVKSRK